MLSQCDFKKMLDAICDAGYASSTELVPEDLHPLNVDHGGDATANKLEIPPEIECPDTRWNFEKMQQALSELDTSVSRPRPLPRRSHTRRGNEVVAVEFLPEPSVFDLPSLNAHGFEDREEEMTAIATSDSLPSLSELSAVLPAAGYNTSSSEKSATPTNTPPSPPRATPVLSANGRKKQTEGRKRVAAPDSFIRWLQHFEQVGADVQRTIDEYAKDETQKASRQRLKKAIVCRVNFAAKKLERDDACIPSIAYFVELLRHQPVKDVTGENWLQLEHGNSAMYRFAEWTIFEQFISTIKHDGDLLDWCVTCAFYLCARIPQANEIFCAVILRYSSILKLDEATIQTKLAYLAEAPAEAITNWLAGERAVLHLFLIVQARLDSASYRDFGYLPRDVPRGQALLRAILDETLELAIAGEPVVLSTASILSTILEAERELCGDDYGGKFKRFIRMEHHLSKLKRVVDHEWTPLVSALCQDLGGDPKMSSVIKSRHEASLAFLSDAIQKTKWARNPSGRSRHEMPPPQPRRGQEPNWSRYDSNRRVR